jgi:prepilin-type N-terminal cleavage/methylation domain-containing protein
MDSFPSFSARKGFTLTEVLMVVVILGILAGLAIPKFYPNKEKAYVAEALNVLSSLRRAQEAYKLEKSGYYPVAPATANDPFTAADWTALGMEDPGSTQWSFSVNGSGIIANRTDSTSGSTYDDTIIRLDSATGSYCGDHPYVNSLPNSLGACS